MSKTTILHIITRLDMGGSAQNTLQTCIGLSKEKYKVILLHGLSLESRMSDLEKSVVEREVERAISLGVKIVPVSLLVRRIDPFRDIILFFRLWHMMIREKPHIVHTHTSKAGILGRWAAKAARVPCIVHTPHGHVFYGHFSSLAAGIFLLAEKITALITDKKVALTKGEKKDYVRLKICPASKIVTIHSGVDTDRYLKTTVNVRDKKLALGLSPGARIVGAIGWLLPIKGPMYLLKAMARILDRCSDVELAYAGKGELKEELQAEARKLGISDNVKFLGWRDDIHEIMPILDVFVLPSLNEGMGRVLVEAMGAGKPVVASDVGGIPDIVRHEETGLLVPPEDEKALAQAIITLLTNPDKARKMGECGKALSHQYNLQAMLEKLEKLYAELTAL